MEGGLIDPDNSAIIKIAAAARVRGVGYFEYLRMLRDARKDYGESAADFELALTLAFAAYKAPPKAGVKKPRV